MKKIFEWMREQMKEISYEEEDYFSNSFLVIDSEDAIEKINEAEAKWESECCEWSPMKYLEFSLSDCLTSCGHTEHYSTGIDKYCRHCGKPIKISEVE